MSLSRIVDLFMLLDSVIEVPVYAAKERDVIIEEIIFTPEQSLAISQNPYTTLEIINKGIDGLGTTVLATVTCNLENTNPDAIVTAFNANVAVFIPLNVKINKDENLAFKKTDFNFAILGYSNLVLIERRF